MGEEIPIAIEAGPGTASVSSERPPFEPLYASNPDYELQTRLLTTFHELTADLTAGLEGDTPELEGVLAVFDADGTLRGCHPFNRDGLLWEKIRTLMEKPDSSGFTEIRAELADSPRPGTQRSAALMLRDASFSDILAAYVPVLHNESRPAAYLVLFTSREYPDTKLLLRSLGIAFASLLKASAASETAARTAATLQAQRHSARRQNALFRLAKQLHGKNDANAVLTEWMDALETFYPRLAKQLYLSQDRLSLDMPVKTLRLGQSGEDICSRAFMEGVLTVSDSGTEGESRMIAAVPIKGRQGVYGVLELKPEQGIIPQDDLQFICMLAETAGAAFENARLFQQTNRLVQELQLINEITHRLNQSLKLNDIFQYATNELIRIFGAEFACILELDHDRRELVVRASDPPSIFKDHLPMDYGFAGMVINRKEPIIIPDYEEGCPIRSVWMEATRSRSLLASPIIVQGEAAGAILVAHRKPNYFTYENLKLLHVLSDHIGLAISNATLHAEVRKIAITDHLTGLYARHYLDDQIAVLQQKDCCGSLILIDIDDFKTINDTRGHQAGDDVLVQVSAIIRSCIRDGDIASRWGGEELAVYLPQVNPEQAMQVAERIRRQVGEQTDPRVTVSCGVSHWDRLESEASLEALFNNADMALYEAKRSGKNQIRKG